MEEYIVHLCLVAGIHPLPDEEPGSFARRVKVHLAYAEMEAKDLGLPADARQFHRARVECCKAILLAAPGGEHYERIPSCPSLRR